MVGYAGVGCHAQVVKDQASVLVQLAHFLCDVGRALRLDHADGEAAQAGDVFRAVAGTDTAAVLVIVPIEDIMAAVFDTPVTAIGVEDVLGIGLIRGAAGDPISDLLGKSAIFFIDDFPFDDESLLDVGEIEVGVKFGGRPDSASFNPAMVGRGIVNEVRFLSFLEV